MEKENRGKVEEDFRLYRNRVMMYIEDMYPLLSYKENYESAIR